MSAPGRRMHLLASAAALVALTTLSTQVAHAELPPPEPLPDGVVAPVHSPADDTPSLLAPVHSPAGDTPSLIAPVHTPLAPVHGPDGHWNRMTTQEGDQFTLSGDVHFEKHEAVLSSTATGILDDVAVSWQSAPPQRVTIVGHTDTDGEVPYNQDLSERRAQAVADYLAEKVPGVEFEVSGKGESEPLRDESEGSPEQQAAAKDDNRRVVLTVPTG